MRSAALILIVGLSAAIPAAAQDEPPKVAGTDVPAPKRTRFVAPAYPEQAQARGQRGIVILELVIDENGKVATADVVRSVPPFDEAAVSAARQWEYEVTKVDGRPVRVRVTVPITFALKLPEVAREDGVPEMRQGAGPGFPPGLEGPATVVADVTLQPDGTVAEATVKQGGSPWAENVLQAIRTWRFDAPPAGTRVAFTVQADFVVAGRPGQPPRVDLKLFGAQRGAAGEAAAAAAPRTRRPSTARPRQTRHSPSRPLPPPLPPPCLCPRHPMRRRPRVPVRSRWPRPACPPPPRRRRRRWKRSSPPRSRPPRPRRRPLRRRRASPPSAT
jgi:TonB family protein